MWKYFILISILSVFPALILADFPFQNTSLDWDTRVKDLLSRLTLDEVVLQMTKGGGDSSNGPAPSIPRLQINYPFQWRANCPHGIAYAGPATSFPQAILTAASFNPYLMYDVAMAIGLEVRAKHNYHVSRNEYGDSTGLTCFSPVANIMLHPLWGRNQETYGEDPFLIGEMVEHHVKGLQGNHPRYTLAAAICKHLAAYNGPENVPVNRLNFNAVVTPRDFELTYFPFFKKCIKAKTEGIMCSYNKVNGIPACASGFLMTEKLRKEWNYTGFVITDNTALEFMVGYSHFYKNYLEVAVGAVNAGVNLELGPGTVFTYLTKAVETGLLKASQLYNLTYPLMMTRMHLGEFDPPAMNPYTKLNQDDYVQSKEHIHLSLESVIQSAVLLKNLDNFLPIKHKQSENLSIALLGPFGDNMTQLYGNYPTTRMKEYEITVKDGLQNLTQKELVVNSVCLDGPKCTSYNMDWLVHTLRTGKFDFIVTTLGTGPALEQENYDRSSINLAGKQDDMLRTILNLTTTPIILLVFSGGPVNLEDYANNNQIVAIWWFGFPAQTIGKAVLHLFSGMRTPAGRLPFTWYKNDRQLPLITDYLLHNQTYRYLGVNPLYQFGYGLTYSPVIYTNLVIPKVIGVVEDLKFSLTLLNGGQVDTDEVVQVYFQWSKTYDMPRVQLVAFQRVERIIVGTNQLVTFTITPHKRQVWVQDKMQDYRGVLIVYVSAMSPMPQDQQNDHVVMNERYLYLRDTVNMLVATVNII